MVLNLVYPDRSDIPFKMIKFPDGQQDIRILKTEGLGPTVTIYSNMNSFGDIELIIVATKILKTLGVTSVRLYVPYFLGARSDRKFEMGSINYTKEVVSPIINNLGLAEVTVMDPHSYVLEACVNNFNSISNGALVKWALNKIEGEYVLVSPDAGAIKKIYDTAKEVDFYGEIITATKHRDIKTGKILSTTIPLTMVHAEKQFVIIDDICDGGRTFVELAKKIRETFPDALIYLIVTHGIFSAGFDELAKYFSCIYTTNSIKEVTTAPLGQVYQLDVFDNQ